MKFSLLLRKIYLGVQSRVLISIDPVRYARSLGVRMMGNVKFYGAKPGMFGSEPWLITLGDNVHIVGGCSFVTHDGGVLILRKDYPDLEITQPITIGNNVYIAMNCIIMPGVTIGNNVIVGAGSIVTKDVPSDTVVAGVPARKIKSLDEYLVSVQTRSLGFGNLPAAEKSQKLKDYFRID